MVFTPTKKYALSYFSPNTDFLLHPHFWEQGGYRGTWPTRRKVTVHQWCRVAGPSRHGIGLMMWARDTIVSWAVSIPAIMRNSRPEFPYLPFFFFKEVITLFLCQLQLSNFGSKQCSLILWRPTSLGLIWPFGHQPLASGFHMLCSNGGHRRLGAKEDTRMNRFSVWEKHLKTLFGNQRFQNSSRAILPILDLSCNSPQLTQIQTGPHLESVLSNPVAVGPEVCFL